MRTAGCGARRGRKFTTTRAGRVRCGRRTWSSGTSPQRRRTGCGWSTTPTCRPGPAWRSPRSSPTGVFSRPRLLPRVDLTVAVLLELGGRDVAERTVEAVLVEPVHPVQRGQFEVVDAAPAAFGRTHSSL